MFSEILKKLIIEEIDLQLRTNSNHIHCEVCDSFFIEKITDNQNRRNKIINGSIDNISLIISILSKCFVSENEAKNNEKFAEYEFTIARERAGILTLEQNIRDILVTKDFLIKIFEKNKQKIIKTINEKISEKIELLDTLVSNISEFETQSEDCFTFIKITIKLKIYEI